MKKLFVLLFTFLTFQSFGQVAWNYQLVYNWNDTTIPATNAYSNKYNAVFGFTRNGHEFAVIGSTIGTHIFDVTDGPNSSMVAYIPGHAQGVNIVHRDYNYYHGYLYAVTDEGSGTLQIIDCHQLPDTAIVVYDTDTLISTSHTVFIDTSTAKIYFNIANHQSDVMVCSLVNPTNPHLLKDYTTHGAIHDCNVRHDTAFLNASNNGMYVVNFSNAQNPVELGDLTTYPFKGYNHSGWRRIMAMM
jgi:hypothetical protein